MYLSSIKLDNYTTYNTNLDLIHYIVFLSIFGLRLTVVELNNGTYLFLGFTFQTIDVGKSTASDSFMCRDALVTSN